MHKGILFTALLVFVITVSAQENNKAKVTIVPVDSGWAANSVNTVIFRKNSLVTSGDTQFISFYNKNRYMVLGKRKLGTQKWELKQTPYQGNTADAHNTISIMVDGQGYVHLSWDHHNNPLRYAKSIYPGSLELTEKLPMMGNLENRVSYPEFYKLADGNLLFFYRDGGSGQGNLVINHYNTQTKTWTQLHSNLIDGERKRNAYWQACTDSKGTIHISWVWRESPDVASNHDLCYARSTDGGKTWEKSTGEKYSLPITATTAEIACAIPQKSELINQTSMFADAKGNPYIATYWREEGTDVPQYHLVYNTKSKWHTQNLLFRSTPFTLSGAGSKRIPIARPQIVASQKGRKLSAVLIFRDEERGSKASVAVSKNLKKQKWVIKDLSGHSLGSWEPSYDTELWKNKGILHLFTQNVNQVDGEGISNTAPQMVEVLEWKPDF